MDESSDRIRFLLEDPVRIGVANACDAAPRTKTQIARALKRDPGGLSAPETMVRRGALNEAGQAPRRGTRAGGKLFVLNPDWRDALADASAQASRTSLPDGLDLILVPTVGAAAACRALVTTELRVAWGALLTGKQTALLLCPSSRPNDDKATLQLADVLGRAGAHPARLRLDRVLQWPDLRRWAAVVVGEEPTELPPGSS